MSSIKKTFPITGMSCASCAVSVESMLKAQKGVVNAIANFADNSAFIEYDEAADLKEFKKAVQSIGYDLDMVEHKSSAEIEAEQEAHYAKVKLNTVLAFVFAVPVLVFGMFFHHDQTGKWISMFLSAVVVFYFGRQFFVKAYKQTKHLKANMDTLVALSTGVSFIFSAFNTYFPQVLSSQGLKPDVYFESAAMITAFILLGKFMEEKAKSNTSAAIKKLIGLQPKTVRVRRDDIDQEIEIEDVLKNEIIVLRPGEKIPVDGEVIEGNSFIDESMITGEALPVEKIAASKVFTGTINQKGSLTIRAEKLGRETLLGQIIRTVQEAQSSKAPVQKLVDKISAVFVPVVIGIAVLTFILWLAIGGKGELMHAFISSVSVLVIACPCALGLATPTAMMVGVGKGAESGILIRNAEALENAKDINLIVLDKTGTITKGKPEVTDMIWLKDGVSEQHSAPVGVITNRQSSVAGDNSVNGNMLAAIEKRSEHPLADAVVRYLNLKTDEVVGDNTNNGTAPVGVITNRQEVAISNFESITGKGVKAQTAAGIYFVGSERLMKEKLIWMTPGAEQQATALRMSAKTVIYFSTDKDLLAIIAIADAVKETSAEAIRELKKNHEVVMLTGDNFSTAQAIAAQVGITDFKAEVLPSEKAKYIAEQKAEGKKVAMVGDGINDSEALAIADISMAMGKGTDIAMNVADITLMHSDLNSVSRAIQLSHRILSKIRQNLFWAFIYNLIGIPIAAGVLYPFIGFQLDPMIAGAAMALSSVSVVGNSLLLKTE